MSDPQDGIATASAPRSTGKTLRMLLRAAVSVSLGSPVVIVARDHRLAQRQVDLLISILWRIGIPHDRSKIRFLGEDSWATGANIWSDAEAFFDHSCSANVIPEKGVRKP